METVLMKVFLGVTKKYLIWPGLGQYVISQMIKILKQGGFQPSLLITGLNPFVIPKKPSLIV